MGTPQPVCSPAGLALLRVWFHALKIGHNININMGYTYKAFSDGPSRDQTHAKG